MIRSIKRRLAKRLSRSNKPGLTLQNISRVISCVALAYTVSLTPAFSQMSTTITTLPGTNYDPGTKTITTTGALTPSGTAINKYTKFDIANPDIVDLIIPGASNGTSVNLIYDTQASQIHGTLRSFIEGKSGIQGDVLFVNPHGVIIGPTGVINVGKLTVSAPMESDPVWAGFDLAPDANVSLLLNGSYAINPASVIQIEGKINASGINENAGLPENVNTIQLQAGEIKNEGEVYTDAIFDISDIVNTNTLEVQGDPSSLVVTESGDIKIVSETSFENFQGELVAGGKTVIEANTNVILDSSLLMAGGEDGINVTASNIYVEASNSDTNVLTEGDLTLTADTITVRGLDDSDNGIYNTTYIETGGNVSFDALDQVNIGYGFTPIVNSGYGHAIGGGQTLINSYGDSGIDVNVLSADGSTFIGTAPFSTLEMNAYNGEFYASANTIEIYNDEGSNVNLYGETGLSLDAVESIDITSFDGTTFIQAGSASVSFVANNIGIDDTSNYISIQAYGSSSNVSFNPYDDPAPGSLLSIENTRVISEGSIYINNFDDVFISQSSLEDALFSEVRINANSSITIEDSRVLAEDHLYIGAPEVTINAINGSRFGGHTELYVANGSLVIEGDDSVTISNPAYGSGYGVYLDAYQDVNITSENIKIGDSGNYYTSIEAERSVNLTQIGLEGSIELDNVNINVENYDIAGYEIDMLAEGTITISGSILTGAGYTGIRISGDSGVNIDSKYNDTIIDSYAYELEISSSNGIVEVKPDSTFYSVVLTSNGNASIFAESVFIGDNDNTTVLIEADSDLDIYASGSETVVLDNIETYSDYLYLGEYSSPVSVYNSRLFAYDIYVEADSFISAGSYLDGDSLIDINALTYIDIAGNNGSYAMESDSGDIYLNAPRVNIGYDSENGQGYGIDTGLSAYYDISINFNSENPQTSYFDRADLEADYISINNNPDGATSLQVYNSTIYGNDGVDIELDGDFTATNSTIEAYDSVNINAQNIYLIANNECLLSIYDHTRIESYDNYVYLEADDTIRLLAYSPYSSAGYVSVNAYYDVDLYGRHIKSTFSEIGYNPWNLININSDYGYVSLNITGGGLPETIILDRTQVKGEYEVTIDGYDTNVYITNSIIKSYYDQVDIYGNDVIIRDSYIESNDSNINVYANNILEISGNGYDSGYALYSGDGSTYLEAQHIEIGTFNEGTQTDIYSYQDLEAYAYSYSSIIIDSTTIDAGQITLTSYGSTDITDSQLYAIGSGYSYGGIRLEADNDLTISNSNLQSYGYGYSTIDLSAENINLLDNTTLYASGYDYSGVSINVDAGYSAYIEDSFLDSTYGEDIIVTADDLTMIDSTLKAGDDININTYTSAYISGLYGEESFTMHAGYGSAYGYVDIESPHIELDNTSTYANEYIDLYAGGITSLIISDSDLTSRKVVLTAEGPINIIDSNIEANGFSYGYAGIDITSYYDSVTVDNSNLLATGYGYSTIYVNAAQDINLENNTYVFGNDYDYLQQSILLNAGYTASIQNSILETGNEAYDIIVDSKDLTMVDSTMISNASIGINSYNSVTISGMGYGMASTLLAGNGYGYGAIYIESEHIEIGTPGGENTILNADSYITLDSSGIDSIIIDSSILLAQKVSMESEGDIEITNSSIEANGYNYGYAGIIIDSGYNSDVYITGSRVEASGYGYSVLDIYGRDISIDDSYLMANGYDYSGQSLFLYSQSESGNITLSNSLLKTYSDRIQIDSSGSVVIQGGYDDSDFAIDSADYLSIYAGHIEIGYDGDLGFGNAIPAHLYSNNGMSIYAQNPCSLYIEDSKVETPASLNMISYTGPLYVQNSHLIGGGYVGIYGDNLNFIDSLVEAYDGPIVIEAYDTLNIRGSLASQDGSTSIYASDGIDLYGQDVNIGYNSDAGEFGSGVYTEIISTNGYVTVNASLPKTVNIENTYISVNDGILIEGTGDINVYDSILETYNSNIDIISTFGGDLRLINSSVDSDGSIYLDAGFVYILGNYSDENIALSTNNSITIEADHLDIGHDSIAGYGNGIDTDISAANTISMYIGSANTLNIENALIEGERIYAQVEDDINIWNSELIAYGSGFGYNAIDLRAYNHTINIEDSQLSAVGGGYGNVYIRANDISLIDSSIYANGWNGSNGSIYLTANNLESIISITGKHSDSDYTLETPYTTTIYAGHFEADNLSSISSYLDIYAGAFESVYIENSDIETDIQLNIRAYEGPVTIKNSYLHGNGYGIARAYNNDLTIIDSTLDYTSDVDLRGYQNAIVRGYYDSMETSISGYNVWITADHIEIGHNSDAGFGYGIPAVIEASGNLNINADGVDSIIIEDTVANAAIINLRAPFDSSITIRDSFLKAENYGYGYIQTNNVSDIDIYNSTLVADNYIELNAHQSIKVAGDYSSDDAYGTLDAASGIIVNSSHIEIGSPSTGKLLDTQLISGYAIDIYAGGVTSIYIDNASLIGNSIHLNSNSSILSIKDSMISGTGAGAYMQIEGQDVALYNSSIISFMDYSQINVLADNELNVVTSDLQVSGLTGMGYGVTLMSFLGPVEIWDSLIQADRNIEIYGDTIQVYAFADNTDIVSDNGDIIMAGNTTPGNTLESSNSGIITVRSGGTALLDGVFLNSASTMDISGVNTTVDGATLIAGSTAESADLNVSADETLVIQDNATLSGNNVWLNADYIDIGQGYGAAITADSYAGFIANDVNIESGTGSSIDPGIMAIFSSRDTGVIIINDGHDGINMNLNPLEIGVINPLAPLFFGNHPLTGDNTDTVIIEANITRDSDVEIAVNDDVNITGATVDLGGTLLVDAGSQMLFGPGSSTSANNITVFSPVIDVDATATIYGQDFVGLYADDLTIAAALNPSVTSDNLVSIGRYSSGNMVISDTGTHKGLDNIESGEWLAGGFVPGVTLIGNGFNSNTQNIEIDSLFSNNIVHVIATDSILDGSADNEDPNITALDIDLYAETGTIGTEDDDLNIKLLASRLDGYADGLINISVNEGNVDLGLMESLTGELILDVLNGSITDANGVSDNIIAPLAFVYASGSIELTGIDTEIMLMVESDDYLTIENVSSGDAFLMALGNANLENIYVANQLLALGYGELYARNIEGTNVLLGSLIETTMKNVTAHNTLQGGSIGNTIIDNVNTPNAILIAGGLNESIATITDSTFTNYLELTGSGYVDISTSTIKDLTIITEGGALIDSNIKGIINVSSLELNLTSSSSAKLGEIIVGGTARITTTGGNIIDGTAGIEDPNIIASDIVLNSSGTIGRANDDLNIKLTSSKLSATSAGGINIKSDSNVDLVKLVSTKATAKLNAPDHTLTINNANVSGTEVTLAGKNINISGASRITGRSSVTYLADNMIVNSKAGAKTTATEIVLSRNSTGALTISPVISKEKENGFKIDNFNTFATNKLYIGNHGNLKNVSSINVNSPINFGGTLLELSAKRGILDSSTNRISITANNLNLKTDGVIGNATNFFDISLSGLLNAESVSNIYLIEKDGALNAGRINSSAGSIFMAVPDGPATIDYISAADTILIRARGKIDINELDPIIVDLSTTGAGSSVNVNSGIASGQVNVQSDNVDMTFNNSNNSSALTYNITGAGGGQANNVTVNTTSIAGVTFNTLDSTTSTINTLTPGATTTLNNVNAGTLYINADILNATNKINIDTLYATGGSSNTANNIVISNTGNLVINTLDTRYAEIKTSGSNLSVNNASITGHGTLANNTYTAFIDNDGSKYSANDAIVLKTGSGFELLMNTSNNIITDGFVLYASPELMVNGMNSDGMINNDIAQVTDTADSGNMLVLSGSSSDTLDNEQFVGFADPALYLDEQFAYFTMAILNRAVEAYQNALNENNSEDEALRKASQVLQNANINASTAEALLKKPLFNQNADFAKLLDYIKSLVTANVGS